MPFNPFESGLAQPTSAPVASQEGQPPAGGGFNPFKTGKAVRPVADIEAAGARGEQLTNEELDVIYEAEKARTIGEKAQRTVQGVAQGAKHFLVDMPLGIVKEQLSRGEEPGPALDAARVGKAALQFAASPPGQGLITSLLSSPQKAATVIEGLARAGKGYLDLIARPAERRLEEIQQNPLRAALKAASPVPIPSELAEAVIPVSPEEEKQRREAWRLNYMRRQAEAAQKTVAPEWLLPAEPSPYTAEAISFAADPLNYVSLGTSAAGRVALRGAMRGAGEAALRQAPRVAETVAEKAAAGVGRAVEKAGAVTKAAGELPEKVAEAIAEKALGPETAGKVRQAVGGAEVLGVPTGLVLGGVPGVAMAAPKTAKMAGAVTEKVGEAAQRVAKADRTDPWGRLHALAKDASAPEWMRRLAASTAGKAVAGTAQAGAELAKGAASGAAVGGALGAAVAETPEEFGQAIGTGGAIGGALRIAASPAIRKARVLEKTKEAMERLYAAHVAEGITPETLKKIDDFTFSTAAQMQHVLGDVKIRFVDGKTYEPIGGKSAGMWDGLSRTIWVNADSSRAAAPTLLHELIHPLAESEVMSRPELKVQIEDALKRSGQTILGAKTRYILSLFDEIKQLPAREKQARLLAEIKKYDDHWQQKAGDPDFWIHSEILAEAGMRALTGQNIFDVVSPSLTSQALGTIRGWLEKAGVTFKEKPGTGDKPTTILPGFENVINDPALRKLTYQTLRAQKDFLPGITKAAEQVTPLRAEDMGSPKAPVYTTPDGREINPYGTLLPDGKGGKRFVAFPPSEVRRRLKAEQAALDKYFPKDTTATAIPAGFWTDPDIPPWTKAAMKNIMDGIKGSTALEGFYHRLNRENSATSSRSWAADVARSLGNVQVSLQSGFPLSVKRSKQGNLLVEWASLEAAKQKAAAWAAKKGDVSLELWAGDQLRFWEDSRTYLQNHRDGLPGDANNLGQQKRDVLNAFWFGDNKEYQAKNPLRTQLRGADRSGVFRSLRADRMETLAPITTEFARPDWEKGKRNFSPSAVGDEILTQAAAEPRALSPEVVEAAPVAGALPNVVGPEKLRLVHFSTQPGLKEISPAFFGKGRANRNDLRGGNKTYFFVEGSPLQADVNIFGQGGYQAYTSEIDGSRIYDLRAGKPDTQGYFKTINREEADANLARAGYDGILVETADGRNVVMMFKPVKATPGGEFKGDTATRTNFYSPDIEVKQGRKEPSAEVRALADSYMAKTGQTRPMHQGYTPVKEDVAKRIADYFDKVPSTPKDPAVQAAYKSFADETIAQWNHITESGVKMEPWTKEGQPYKNSSEMMADVKDNKHLWFFPTDQGFGTGEAGAHPLLAPSGIEVNGKQLLVNDIFRAVHDYFGHSKEGYEFGPRGELNAYLAHAGMFSDAARPAMAAETLGQNSWVNYGAHLRDAQGNIPKKGQPGYKSPTERPFAEQKVFLMPRALMDEAAGIGLQPGTYSPSPNPRAVRMAAVRDKEGKIYEGLMHAMASAQYWETKYPGDDNNALRAWNSVPELEEGFVTNSGEFLSREGAYQRALELKQYKPVAGDEGSLESQAFARQQQMKEMGYEPTLRSPGLESGETPKKVTLKPEDKGANAEDAGFGNFWLAPDGKFHRAGDHQQWAFERTFPSGTVRRPRDGKGLEADEIFKAANWVRISREREASRPAVFLEGRALTHKQKSALEVWAAENPDVEIVDTGSIFYKNRPGYSPDLPTTARPVVDDKLAMRYAKRVAALTEAKGGSTFNVKSGKTYTKDPVFNVSIYPDRSVVLKPAEVTPERIAQFIKDNSDLLNRKDNSVGTWKDPETGNVWLDVAWTTPNRELAEYGGWKYNQKAIWDLKGAKEIMTGGTGAALENMVPAAERIKALTDEWKLQNPEKGQKELMGRVVLDKRAPEVQNVRDLEAARPARDLTPTELAAADLAQKELKERVQLLPSVEDRTRVRRALQRGMVEVGEYLKKQEAGETSFKSGRDWYREDIEAMEKTTQTIFPETKDRDKMTFFKVLLAAFSGGEKPKNNFQLAAEAFSQYLKTGKVPSSTPFRVSEAGAERKLGRLADVTADKLNNLLEQLGSEKAFVDYMMTKHDKTILGHENSYGAMDLGPKFGRFLLNLTGHADEVTVDLWATRTWNRWMGTPFRRVEGETGKKMELMDAPTDAERALIIETFQGIADAISAEYGTKLDPMDAQAMLWFYEKDLYGGRGVRMDRGLFSDAAKAYAENPIHTKAPRVTGVKPKKGAAPEGQGALFSPEPGKFRDAQLSAESRRKVGAQYREDAARYRAMGKSDWAEEAEKQAAAQERLAEELDAKPKTASPAVPGERYMVTVRLKPGDTRRMLGGNRRAAAFFDSREDAEQWAQGTIDTHMKGTWAGYKPENFDTEIRTLKRK